MADTDRNAWQYVSVEGHWDEASLPSGLARRHWRDVALSIGRMGRDELRRSWQTEQQLIQANGTSYNVGDELRREERAWPLDPIPLVIGENEWAGIERAIIQRATLLNAILADLYGPQRLLHTKQIPPALLFANPSFLRPCHGAPPRNGVYLHSYAADLARSPDGRWHVMADRTQAPAGLGYTLENRLVGARAMCDIFSACRVRQLARFFDIKRDALLRLAASRQTSPRIVLLTSGPHSETYFEHSFLAGHWGFPLVEGADLAMRDNRVFLKTITGLEPIDLIVRRLDDSFCDPLELRSDSLLGVPGLMQAVRAGTIAIDNALGTGLLEAPAYVALLPELCRHILGEDLLLPSIATWWCGQEHARRYVLDHLHELVIIPAFARTRHEIQLPASMDSARRERLVAKIHAQPEFFAAQERVPLSTAPVFTDAGIEARHLVLRVFSCWSDDSYRVLPGGLTRVSAEKFSPTVSLHLGGGTKDTWIPGGSGEPVPAPAPLGESTVHPGWTTLPSRVADNLFWLGRYAERFEGRLRLIRALLPALSGEEDFGRAATLEAVVGLLIRLEYLPSELSRASLGEQLWRVQHLLANLIDDESRPTGLGWNLKQMRRVALNLKERLSSDTWRVLQQIDADFSDIGPDNSRRGFSEINLLDRAIVTLSAFAGQVTENTTRGPGWNFLEIGRRLERARYMADLLQAGVADAPGEIEPYLRMLLYIADSSITYRTRYLTTLRTDLVLDLLLVDESNPRSLGFQLAALLNHVGKLPGHDDPPGHAESQRILRNLNLLRATPAADLARRDQQGHLQALGHLLEQLKTDMYDLSDQLSTHYMSPVVSPQFVAFR